MRWTPGQLDHIGSAVELEIAVPRSDGTQGSWTPIWVVTTDGEVFVRTWYRRSTGWFGRVLKTARARIRVPGVEIDVCAEDVGTGSATLRAAVDDAYRGKYGGSSADRMVGDDAAATTLRLTPE
ncbi:DUF2255 family protein [Candidatus Mycobacterium wuenschmannii]|uniref:DUF2255 family protein n=1 Tax=Candidatus Mycobacterium wuenschmannii TaxID=3027808 RepID=A0ABY8W3E5_9MYCO|nr:DUF2255 family protein [Candidatus Mycobacterium wuenschmannii]WIM89601.1 DUF2255 family protein [Candidatus Mycobacterium wuenschmannii]